MNRSKSLVILILILTINAIFTVLISAYLIRGKILQSLVEEEARSSLAIAEQTAGLLEKEIATIQEKVNLLTQFPQIQDGDTATCNKKLAEVAPYLKANIDNITRFNTRLTLDCAINQAAVGYVLTPNSPITAVIRDPNHAPYLSYSGYSPISKQEVLYLNLPFYSSKGVYSGIIGGVIYLNYLSDKYLKNLPLEEGAYVTLIDDSGNFLYYPNNDYIGKNLNSPDLMGNDPDLRSFNERAVEESKINKSGAVRYSVAGREMLSVYAPAHVFQHRIWTVVVTMPVQAILSKITSTEGFGGLSLFISLAGVVIITFILFSAIVLYFVIRKINESNLLLEQRVQERTRELERAKLSIEETVEKRTAELEELKDSLEEKVKERTHALEERAAELEQRNRLMVDRELKMIQLKEENESLKSKLGGDKKTA